jgi:hypothetical protein
MSDRKALIEQANELGLEFPGNISTKKLEAMLSESKGPAVKAEVVAEVEPAASPKGKKEPEDPRQRVRMLVAAAKKAATAKSIVTLTNKDPRENATVTTAHLSVENQHFGVSRIVPLDIPVELEQCLIDLAESTMMTLHRDEVAGGKRTGNKVAVSVKKFAVSYSRQKH